MSKTPAKTQTPLQASVGDTSAPPTPQFRPATRKAIDILIEEDVTQREAARRAGVNERALSNCLRKPHVSRYVEHQRSLYVKDLEKLKERAQAMAYRVAIDLMQNASSEAIKRDMVEFITGGRKGGGVNVQINNTNSKGYEFPPPGARVVDIEPN